MKLFAINGLRKPQAAGRALRIAITVRSGYCVRPAGTMDVAQ
ncbi:hypothetical protein NXZ69_11215 [Xanthomonas hortorum pv. pelargonii]|nr:hypothetical protein [Xanthomonas hortorum]MCU1705215.1 hypothetical protein [Xanthomonas hortorum pv. pelargonii]MCU1713452.1 hypothetical protein [Xanthomonas hortorum pv. pelargonii]MDC8648876.1 hypothetical protein [Xanthomonas hortorum pv. pelargonii]MDC8682786.1 hypothetical protein [Xanthomonas hortorum pv. pelargonii]MDC8699613.1 hypothetical protein [Xanthomonas hortorum pv. pelargonii]